MLVANNSSKVLFFKLLNGEEIIAYCTKSTAEDFVITKPLLVILSRGESDDQGYVNFVPWIVCADPESELTIKKSMVVTYSVAKTEASSQYISAVGPTNNPVETERKVITNPILSRSRH